MTTATTVSEWVEIGSPVLVAGVPVSDVYVGQDGGADTVDPTLPVDHSAPDWAAHSVTRPPRYAELTPQARAAFLAWHGYGRRSPQAPAVWALLHLYGLERRILVDGDTAEHHRDEARRLGQAYGSDPDVARLAQALGGDAPHTGPPPRTGEDVPDELQVELGRRALASEPVPAEWALAWAWFHPDIPRREARTHAPDEFARLWTIRFAERHPDGLLVRPRRRRLALPHAPANPDLPSPLEVTVLSASDVFLTPDPAEELRGISDQVEAELAALARWRTRFPDEPADSVRLATVLPHALFAGSPSEAAARAVVDVAEAGLDGADQTVVDGAHLLDTWREATARAAGDRRDAVEIAQVLERFGVGLEPDVRFGGRPPARESRVVLFRHAGVPTTSPSNAYASALVTLELCAAVAVADGTVDEAEQAVLVERVRRAEGLDESLRTRLDAHRVLVTTGHVALDDVARRMVGLPVAERHALATHLIDLARVDGVVTDDERDVLRRVHELLEIDPSEVDRRLRLDTPIPAPNGVEQDGADSASPEPEAAVETESAAAGDAQGSVAPPAEPATPRLVGVDEDALRATQENNRRVQALLADIFDAADDDAAEGDDSGAPAPADGIASLDAAHSALLHELAQRRRATRRELELAAARHGVLPDGALDVINEAALDLTEDPVIEAEDDESVTIDHDVYEEMCA